MVSTFHSIETSKRALFAQQTALSTVGHNIANANTEGYSRQRVNMQTSISLEALGRSKATVKGQIGTGVEYESITRIRNSFLDDQYRDQNSVVGSSEIVADTLDKLESFVAEPSDNGIRTVIDSFWSAWSELSKDPENTTGREIVREVMKTLVDSFNDFNKQLTDLSDDLTSSINIKADEINETWNAISELNEQIFRLEITGDHANDLRDRRDLLTDKLSKLANITVMEGDRGYVINLAGNMLQAGSTVTGDSLLTAYQAGELTGGEMHGFIKSRELYVKEFANEIKTLAETMANGNVNVKVPKGTILPGTTDPLTEDTTIVVQGINGLHKLGYTLEDGPPPAQRGGDIFEFITDENNESIFGFTMAVNQDILDNSNKIATSIKTITGTSESSVLRGNNDIALLMADLSNSKFDFGLDTPKATVNDFYSSTVGALGVQVRNAERLHSNSSSQLHQIENSRLSVSNVSLDEEMSDLIKFQYAYSSSARFMTTIDELLNKLINGTGRVGL